MTLDEFFAGYKKARQLFEAVRRALDGLDPVTLRVTKSQIAFRRRRTFAWVWIPAKYLRGKPAPLVLTLSFKSRDKSKRWKEIVEPTPGHVTHHLELRFVAEIDAEVHRWLHEAWTAAG
jgi:predicted transport protein